MNSKFYCEVCSKSYTEKRNLKRHIFIEHEEKRFDCNICKKKFTRKSKLIKHSCNKTITSVDRKSLEDQLLLQTYEFKEQIEMGKKIAEILNSNANVEEAALNESQKKTLHLYQSSNTLTFNLIKLRPWQKDLISYFDNPTFRKIIWVTGENGNEGKTFLQKYIKSIYGTRRVLLINMVKRSENIFHILTKESLICKDVFLFNLSKSFSIFDCPFEALEAIKDGQALSSKYNSSILNFKTPNTVIVFSNDYPRTNRLSSDRWLIFRIINDNLVNEKTY